MIVLILSIITFLVSAKKPSPPSFNEIKAEFTFSKCLSDDSHDGSTNSTCEEPEWRTKPIKISFKDMNSVGTKINLDVTGLAEGTKLNYDSPALSFLVESSTVPAGKTSPFKYFTIRPHEEYDSEFVTLEEKKRTKWCDLPDKTSWTFDRAEKDDEESSVTIVLAINGNQTCSYLELIMKYLKKYWYLAIAAGVLLIALCCCMMMCCGCSCCWCCFSNMVEAGAKKVWDDVELV